MRVQELNTKLLGLRSELFAFEKKSPNVELVRIWNHAWFTAIKAVSESFLREILPQLQHELLVDYPPYFQELVTIEASKTFLSDFYRHLLPFLVDDLNILRGLAKDIKDLYPVFLEARCADCRVFTHVVFNYELLGVKKVAKVGANIRIKVRKSS